MKTYSLKSALAEMRGISALIIQTDDPFVSAELLLEDMSRLTPTLVQIEEKVYLIIYNNDGELKDGYLLNSVDKESAEFVKATKNNETWLLVIQVVSHNNEDGKIEKLSCISIKNIGDGVHIGEPQFKNDWIVSL